METGLFIIWLTLGVATLLVATHYAFGNTYVGLQVHYLVYSIEEKDRLKIVFECSSVDRSFTVYLNDHFVEPNDSCEKSGHNEFHFYCSKKENTALGMLLDGISALEISGCLNSQNTLNLMVFKDFLEYSFDRPQNMMLTDIHTFSLKVNTVNLILMRLGVR